MSLKKHSLQVLTILFENLQESHPQLVPSAAIAENMDISLQELQKVLKPMKGMGVIESDSDLQYNLITPKGLIWLGERNPIG